MTCKAATRHDYIWLWPETVALCQDSRVHHSFADHVVLEAKFQVPSSASTVYTWPRPSCFPWQEVDVNRLHVEAVPFAQDPSTGDSTQWYRDFSRHWENEVAEQVSGQGQVFPSQCRGRAHRLQPATRDIMPNIPKASRPGEVVMASNLACREVKRWFQQLRRLQSLRDALRGDKQTPQAIMYREQLWKSIRDAAGFTPSFFDWWPRRAVQLHGSPMELGTQPDCAASQVIFADFHENYKKLEGWHLRRRADVLAAKHAESTKHLFAELRPAKPQPLDTLVLHRSIEVLAVDEATGQVHLEEAPPNQGSSNFSVEGQAISLQMVDGPLGQIAAEDVPRV